MDMGKRLGMIGLGKMGLALARAMMADGHEVYGYDIDPARMKMLEEAGGHPVASAKEMARLSDITFSILLKPEHIEENTLGPNGIAAAGAKGLIHVEMSTMLPKFQRELAEKLGVQGIETLDAPISGSTPHVDARTITFMVGGKKEVFEKVLPIFQPLAASVEYMGPNGTGATMKIVTNMFVNSSMALLAEMVLVGERAGLSHETMMKCLRAGSVRGAMLEIAGPTLMARDFAPRGAVEIFYKDMGMALELARENGIELQVVKAAREMFKRAYDAGWAKDDATRVIEVYEGKDRK
jgi:3-hydroxyisobutyrate dehydrogenase-like beta-hydroxyacid dehydrogenase